MASLSKDARLWVGIAIGGGGALAFPFVAPILAAVARPLTKALLAQGLVALERSREQLAHAAEGLEDILAEVQAEAAEALAARKEAAREAAGDLAAPAPEGAPTAAGKEVN